MTPIKHIVNISLCRSISIYVTSTSLKLYRSRLLRALNFDSQINRIKISQRDEIGRAFQSLHFPRSFKRTWRSFPDCFHRFFDRSYVPPPGPLIVLIQTQASAFSSLIPLNLSPILPHCFLISLFRSIPLQSRSIIKNG